MLEVGREIGAPAPVVWDLLTDTRAWSDWGPSVRAVRAPARYLEAGMRGRVVTALRLPLPFLITEVKEERLWRWRVGGVSATGHRVEALGPARCRCVFEVPLWAAPYALVCRLALRRLARIAERRAAAT